MPALSEPLDPSSRRLVEIAADGWSRAGGRWPVWQFVALGLESEGISAASAITRLPSWQHNYKPVALTTLGTPPELGQPVTLTVHGMAHAGGAVARHFLPAFLGSLRLAAAAQLETEPDPTRVVPVELPGRWLTQEANMATGSGLSMEQLYDTLKAEPVSWGAVRGNAADWRWDLTGVHLGAFADLSDGDAYLSALEDMVGWPTSPGPAVYLPPLAVVDALDHLDLAWRLVTGKRLVMLPRTALAGRLVLPVSTVEEFESRCSTLADVLSNLHVDPDGEGSPEEKSLGRLRRALLRYGSDEGSRAVDGVVTLRRITRLRNAQQHTAAAHRFDADRRALGLDVVRGDWDAAWEQVRSKCVQALDDIREAVVRVLDEPSV